MEANVLRKGVMALAVSALMLGGIACATTDTQPGEVSDTTSFGPSNQVGTAGTIDSTPTPAGVSSGSTTGTGTASTSGSAGVSAGTSASGGMNTQPYSGTAAAGSTGTTSTQASMAGSASAGTQMTPEAPNVNTTTTDRVDTPTDVDRTASNETPTMATGTTSGTVSGRSNLSGTSGTTASGTASSSGTTSGRSSITGTTGSASTTTTAALDDEDIDDDATAVRGTQERRTMRKD